jgi:hypothetical protein
LYEVEELFDFRFTQEKAFPKVLRVAAGGDAAFNLRPRHEGQLLLALRVDQAGTWEIVLHVPHTLGPVPRRAERVQFLLYRDGRYAVRGGAPGNMPLEVGMGKACDQETLSEGGGKVGQVDFRGVQGVFLYRPVADGLEVAIADPGEGNLRLTGLRGGVGRLGVMAEEGHDVHAGRQG